MSGIEFNRKVWQVLSFVVSKQTYEKKKLRFGAGYKYKYKLNLCSVALYCNTSDYFRDSGCILLYIRLIGLFYRRDSGYT